MTSGRSILSPISKTDSPNLSQDEHPTDNWLSFSPHCGHWRRIDLALVVIV
jgi:hypothetical protein